MQSGVLHRDTMVEMRVNVLVFAHGPYLRSTSTAHGINMYLWWCSSGCNNIRRPIVLPVLLLTQMDERHIQEHMCLE